MHESSKILACIPVDEYMAVAKNFNPVIFDAKAITQLAIKTNIKSASLKEIRISPLSIIE